MENVNYSSNRRQESFTSEAYFLQPGLEVALIPEFPTHTRSFQSTAVQPHRWRQSAQSCFTFSTSVATEVEIPSLREATELKSGIGRLG